jgi:hypothetical protein
VSGRVLRAISPWRRLAASHSSSGMMRSAGTSLMIHSFSLFSRDRRFPVVGSLM